MMVFPFFPPKPTRGGLFESGLCARLCDDGEWVAEPKWNGVRVLVARTSDRSLMWSRVGTPLRIPGNLTLLLERLPETLLDGELVGDTLHLFDLPRWPGPYTERRRELMHVIAPVVGPHVHLVTTLPGWSPADLHGLMEEDPKIEGVVFKRRASPYTPCHAAGCEVGDWLKFFPR